MGMHQLYIGFICLSFIVGCNAQPESTSASGEQASLTKDQVIQRIIDGEIGVELAERAKKSENLWVQEIDQKIIPMQIFYYSDDGSGISVLVENEKLILLCAGWGSGPVSDLTVISRGGKKVLRYTYTTGSGIQQPCESEYVLGSGAGFSEVMTNGDDENYYSCDD